MCLLEEYVSYVEKRILKDQWRVGWFKSNRNIIIDDLKCEFLIYGHSKYFKSKNFIIPRLNIPHLYPYGAVAILIYKEKFLDISFIEKTIDSVKKLMLSTKITTPEGIKCGVDVAFVAIATYETISKDLAEYIMNINPEIYNQYMEASFYGRKIYKKIGLAAVDLRNEVVYAGDNIFSREARKLFNPKHSIIERIKDNVYLLHRHRSR